MSTVQDQHPHTPWHGLLHAVAERLIPLFQTAGQSNEYARRAAREAIAAYRAESCADYASIGRILALSFATIAAVAQAATPDVPPDVQLRFLTKANTLSRSADQAERGMTQRRQRRRNQSETEHSLVTPPAAGTPTPEAPAAETPAARTSAPKAPATRIPAAKASPSEPTDEAIFAQIDAAIADLRTVAPDVRRAPFAAAMPAAPPPSFRQFLRNQASPSVLRAAG